jgi:4-amino-4-deoxy-L-arabinose transferase-like glycosyltransferase
MTSTLSRGAFDDDALRKLAQEPARPLFPLLSRAEVMFPLVVVLAFLPALYAVDNRTLSEAGAWEGISGLNCLGAQSLGEFVDPAAGDPEHPFPYQPPLMSWLTAIGMKLLGTERPAGVLVPVYLCTAFLIIAGYVLGRRIGGEQFGLVAAVLMALNPQLLAGAQEPLPQSLACLLAMLSLAGVVAHWQKSSGILSYQLLLGGIALGFCLLAGGPLALAILLIVLAYVACWKLDVRFRGPAGPVRERSQFTRRTAFRATAVLAVTAFALGGWNVLFMSSRYELDFWEGWLNGGMTPPVDPVLQEGPAGFLDHLRELAALVRPLFGIALLGIVGIVRDWWRAEEDPARHHRGLLLVWVAVALVIYFLIQGRLDPESPAFKMWELLLAVPLVMSAALGFIDIAERRIGFVPAMVFGTLALADIVLMAGDGFSHRKSESALFSLGGVRLVVLDAISLTALAAGLLCAVRHARKSDRRKRVVLTVMLAAIGIAATLWGAVEVRRTADGDRELDELRSGMARLPRTNECTFVALASPGTSLALRPPPQVVFVIGSVWPAARMYYARSWEDAAQQAPPEMASPEAQPLFLAWSLRGSLRNAVPAANLRSVSPPFHYRDLEFAAYVRGSPPSVAMDK